MIKAANAPCSWGVLELGLEGKSAGYAQVLDEIAETGYTGTELGDWGFMPTDPGRLRAELHQRGLTLVGAFVPVSLKNPLARSAGIATAVRTAHLLAEAEGAIPFIVLADDNGRDPLRTQNAGRIRPEQGLTTVEWQIAAETVTSVAQSVRDETGLRTVFHHHCGGYVETPAEIDMLMGLTDPDLVGLCLDTGHYRFGGGDPLAGLQKYSRRIWHVHFKDCQPEIARCSRQEGWDYVTSIRNGIFCELGRGDIDFTAIRQTLAEMGYGTAGPGEGWVVVEQDVLPGMGSPKESARRNRLFLEKIGIPVDPLHLTTRSVV